MKLTRRQFLIYGGMTVAVTFIGGKAIKYELDVNECISKETKTQQRMYGTSNLSDYVKGEVKRVCRSGKER